MTGSSHARPADRGDAGFTLLEALVALTILALAATALAPTFGAARPAAAVDGAARDIAAALKDARAAAVRSGIETAVAVDTEHNTVTPFGASSPRALAPGIGMTLVTLRGEQTGAGAGRLRFYPDGSATGGRITLRQGRHTALVDVDWLTGATRVTAHD